MGDDSITGALFHGVSLGAPAGLFYGMSQASWQFGRKLTPEQIRNIAGPMMARSVGYSSLLGMSFFGTKYFVTGITGNPDSVVNEMAGAASMGAIVAARAGNYPMMFFGALGFGLMDVVMQKAMPDRMIMPKRH